MTFFLIIKNYRLTRLFIAVKHCTKKNNINKQKLVSQNSMKITIFDHNFSIRHILSHPFKGMLDANLYSHVLKGIKWRLIPLIKISNAC